MAFADAGCVLKVHFNCDSCKMKMVEVLASVIGVYNVEYDGDYVKITGEMDPNRLVKAVARTGPHAKLVKANFKHPNWDPYNSTSLDYHQWAAQGLTGMHGGVDPFYGGHGFADPFYGGGAGFAGMHGGGGPGFAGMHGGGGPGYAGMNGGGMHYPCGGLEFAEEYPFPPTSNGFHHRRPATGAGFGGPWYPPPAFGGRGGPWFPHM